MSYPNALDIDTTPGASIYPPQSTQSPGALTSAPVAVASPTLSQWLQRVADSLIGVETTLGLPASPAAGSILALLASKISEAPTDGNLYGRENSGWVQVPPPGIADAPNDANTYARHALAWTQAPAEAPTDGRIYGRQSGVWSQVPTAAARSILQLFIFGDSYSDSGNSNTLSTGNNTAWPAFKSDGPAWSWLIATLLGIPVNPRYSSASPLGTNYAVASSDANTGPIFASKTYSLTDQITQFLADYSNTIPAGSGIVIWDGINDVQAAVGSFSGTQGNAVGQGMPNSTDPVTTLSADFIQPAVNSGVSITVGSTAMFNLYSPQDLMIGNSRYQVTSITDATHAVVNNIGGFSNPAASAPIAPGGTVSSAGGTTQVRWTGAAYVDMIVPVITAQVQRLVTAGAANIVYINCPDISIAVGQQGKACAANVTYFNTKLAAALASIHQVTLYDSYSLWTNIEGNPNSYGIRNLDSYSQLHTTEPARDFMFWDNIHPSSSTHSFLANGVLNTLASVYGNSVQMANATSAIGNIWPNGTPPLWTPAASTPYPDFVLANDPRLNLAELTRSRGKFITFYEEYDSGSNAPTKYTWTTLGAGGGGQGNATGGTATYGTDGYYSPAAIAVNDAFAQMCTSKQTKSQVGAIDLAWRVFLNIPSAGDGITVKFGLIDALATLANGWYWQLALTNAQAGAYTGSFIAVSGGTQIGSFTLPSSINQSDGRAHTFRAVSDYEWVRWSFYFDGTFLGLIKFSNYATAPVYPFHQIVKTAGTTQAWLYVDFASYLWNFPRGVPASISSTD